MENEKSVLAIDDIYRKLNDLYECIGEMHCRMRQIHSALIGVPPTEELGDKPFLTLEERGYYALLKDKIDISTVLIRDVLTLLKDF